MSQSLKMNRSNESYRLLMLIVFLIFMSVFMGIIFISPGIIGSKVKCIDGNLYSLSKQADGEYLI